VILRLTLVVEIRLVKGMKLSKIEMERLVRKVFDELKSNNTITFKQPEEKVFKRAVELVVAEFNKEAQLDNEVNRMMDDLERQNPGSFERYKMFPLLKKRLAKEKGIVL